jgi:hypothetical protein
MAQYPDIAFHLRPRLGLWPCPTSLQVPLSSLDRMFDEMVAQNTIVQVGAARGGLLACIGRGSASSSLLTHV